MDLVSSLLVQFGTLSVVVWGILQALPASTRWPGYKLPLSFLLGPAFGMIGHAVGLVDLGGLVADSNTHMGEETRHLMAAAFLGLLSTVLAKMSHDYVIDPLLSRGKDK